MSGESVHVRSSLYQWRTSCILHNMLFKTSGLPNSWTCLLIQIKDKDINFWFYDPLSCSQLSLCCRKPLAWKVHLFMSRHAVVMQLSCSCHAVIMQLSCSCHAVVMQLSCSCHAVVMQLSGRGQAFVRYSSCSHHAVIKQLLGSGWAVIR